MSVRHTSNDIIEPTEFNTAMRAWRYVSKLTGRIALLSDAEHQSGDALSIATAQLDIGPFDAGPAEPSWAELQLEEVN